MQEKFENLEVPTQPKNTMKITLTNEATGEIDYETEIENTVGLIMTQKANMDYKGFAFNSRYAGVYNSPFPGNNNIALQLYDYNPGVSSDNAYTNLNQYTLNGSINYDAVDSTRNSTFHVYNVYPTYLTFSNVLNISTFNVGANIIMAGDTVTQGANTTTVTSVIDANHIQVANITGWIGQNDPAQTGTSLTAFCYQNAITTSGTQGGIYLPQLSGYNRNRSYTWTYEWGTTQGNGVISSIGYFENGAVPITIGNGGGMIQVAAVPEMYNAGTWTYAGWKDNGARKQLHFVTRNTIANNVVVVNHDDFSLVSQANLTNPTGLWSTNSHDIIYTPVGGGQYYGIVSVSSTSFTYKKCAESGNMTFGGNITKALPVVPGWYPDSGSSTINFYNWTADQNFIYALVYDNNNYQSAIMTFDPSTDTVVSIVKNPAGFGGVGGVGDSNLFNICPVTGKLLTLTGSYITEWASITQPATNNYIASWINGVYLSDSRDFLMHQTTTPTDRLVGFYSTNNGTYLGAFFEITRGNFYTYAELLVPITKTNTQSLRVSYTLNFA
jgi:hypothetical protein